MRGELVRTRPQSERRAQSRLAEQIRSRASSSTQARSETPDQLSAPTERKTEIVVNSEADSERTYRDSKAGR